MRSIVKNYRVVVESDRCVSRDCGTAIAMVVQYSCLCKTRGCFFWGSIIGQDLCIVVIYTIL